MVDRAARRVASPRHRLERWLVRQIQGGALYGLPHYRPLGSHAGECPDLYAQSLLNALGSAEGDREQVDRLIDDGRAFRSWTESALSGALHHSGPLRREIILTRY